MAEKFQKAENDEKAENDDKDNKIEVENKETVKTKFNRFASKLFNKFGGWIDSALTPNDLDETPDPNIAFYCNEIAFYPSGYKIETILNEKYEDYRFLEETHTYIQWLFPNRKPGMNRFACILTDHDTEVISKTPELRARVRRAFEMMLGFYGMRLTEEDQFELAPNAQQRLILLNRPFNHNFLRITRILLAIKELGHHRLMLPWMKFLADLIYKDDKTLNFAASSLNNHWLETLDAEDEIALKLHLSKLKSTRSSVVSSSAVSTTTNTINGDSTNSSLSATINNTTSTRNTKSVDQKNNIQSANYQYRLLPQTPDLQQSPTRIQHDRIMNNVYNTPSETTPNIEY